MPCHLSIILTGLPFIFVNYVPYDSPMHVISFVNGIMLWY